MSLEIVKVAVEFLKVINNKLLVVGWKIGGTKKLNPSYLMHAKLLQSCPTLCDPMSYM